MAEGEDRPSNFEDLFDDLDKFFQPDPTGQRRAGAEQAAAGPPEPAGDDILPDDWAAGVADLGSDIEPVTAAAVDEPAGGDEGADEDGAEDDLRDGDDAMWRPGADEEPATPTPTPSDAPAGETEDRWESRPAAGPEPPAAEGPPVPGAPVGDVSPPVPDRPLEHTAEMSTSDWRRLRDVLGDEEDASASSFEFSAETPEVTDESGFEFGAAGRPAALAGSDNPSTGSQDEPHELTLEDLKKAPPVYRNLPGVEGTGGPGGESEEGSGLPLWDERAIADVTETAGQVEEDFGRDEPAAPLGVDDDLLPHPEPPSGPRTVKVGEPEALLAGPTWEEPASRPFTREPTPPRGGRNMPVAVVSAVVLVAAALVTLAVAKAVFAILAGIVVLYAQGELYGTVQRRGYQPATALGLLMGGLVLAGAYLKGEPAMAFFLALSLVLSFFWYMAAPPKARENALGNIGVTMLGIAYVPFMAGFILMILAQRESGKALMLAVLGLTFLYDVAAYFFGSLWGRRPLAATISPKKSWEGLFGATVVTFIVAISLVPTAIHVMTFAKAVGLFIVIAVFAPLGDLAESLLKRDLGVKDMGWIIPGHGGALDRIDSLLLVAPAAFYFLRLIFH
jgi:phosphatidate cytidylyltransferase